MAYIRNISGTYMNYIGNIYEIGYMGRNLAHLRRQMWLRMAHLSNTLTDDTLRKVMRFTNAREVWMELCTSF